MPHLRLSHTDIDGHHLRAVLRSEPVRANEFAARSQKFARFAWGVLAWNVLVVLWGAFVRASYSGDGCGSHWPLCNGEVLPTAPGVQTLIEFSHRVTSGIALLLVIALVWRAHKTFAVAHPTRRAARWALGFTISEALIGAGLVVFGLVANDDSVARALSLCVHLVNTFLLLAALALAAWWSGAGVEENFGRRGLRATLNGAFESGASRFVVFACAFLSMLLVSTSGAIAALGDTLFPAASLADAWSQEFAGTAHALVRLRVLHPVCAVLVAATLLWAARLAARDATRPQTIRLSRMVALLVAAQMLAGGLNVLLLAPAWMQLVHLLLADLLWIAFVLLTADVFAAESVRADARRRARRHAFALQV